MINLRTKAFDPGTFRNLEINEIISAPLTAASSANNMMAREQVRFLMDFCFSKEGENYKPVMIKMAIVNGVIQPGEEASMRRITTTFNLPLLTIIPISSLAVEDVSVDFEIELTSQTQIDRQVALAQPESPLAPAPKARLLGRISYDSKENPDPGKRQYRSSNASGLKVNIKAGQVPLALGLTTLLDLYTKSIGPVEQQDEVVAKKE